jgi:hypothetical protein
MGPCPNPATAVVSVWSWGLGRQEVRPACEECAADMPDGGVRLSPEEAVAWEVMES